MKMTNWLLSSMVCCTLACLTTPAATLYVWQGSPSPASPFTNWTTAAHTIQEAVDAAQPGETVLVTNGVYATGGKAVYGLMTNRVAVEKAIEVLSLNGPSASIILGAKAPSGGNGDGAIRCVYLADGAVLSGFTLTNGTTRAYPVNDDRELDGGGVWCESTNALVLNCVLTGNSAQRYGGGAVSGTLNACTLTGNSAYEGAGAYYGTLNHCALTGNSAQDGGGAYHSTLNNCTLTDNSAYSVGGGVAYGSLNNCTLTDNSAVAGGGVYQSTLNNCTLKGNLAEEGGGMSNARLNNCTLTDNWAERGGGAYSGTLNNCTLTGNSALSGGGTYGGTLMNCIVYYNTANVWPNSYGETVTNCCTFPASLFGVGNITNEPLFVDRLNGNLRLQSNSPCINAGNNAYVTFTTDLDGNERIVGGLVDMGAYEYRGAATLYVWQDSPSPGTPYGDWTTAAHTIQDAVDAARAGDTVVVTNGVYSSGGKAVGTNVLVSRVAVDKSITLQSVNGPQVTFVEGAQAPGGGNGDGAIRCVYLTNGAILSGFTLTNGATRTDGDFSLEAYGGGVWCESTNALVTNCTLTGNTAWWDGGGAYEGTLNNCTLTSNLATYGGGAAESTLDNCILTGNLATADANGGGGGAAGGTLNNCTLTGNSAYDGGGGAAFSTLNNCTLTGNWATKSGGGAVWSELNNCIVYYNTAPDMANYDYSSTLNFCCTTPAPGSGSGNIANEPAFVDRLNGNLRLQSNSPGINAGYNIYVTTTTDLDGRPRIVGGTVDMGAYEYQPGVSGLFIGWLQQYGLPTDGSADQTDPDGDLMNNWQEWQADTNPTNGASVLRLTILPNTPPVAVTFSSSAARRYTLQCCTNLVASSESFDWTPVPGRTDILGSGGVLILTDTNPPAPAFYRVSVRYP